MSVSHAKWGGYELGNNKGKGKQKGKDYSQNNIGPFPQRKRVTMPEWHIERKSVGAQRTSTGKRLAGVLRHKALEFHIRSIGVDGWCDMREVWKNCEFLHFASYGKPIDNQWIRDMAGSTDKERFEFDPPEYGQPIRRIRCRQGHSMSFIDNDSICTRVTRDNMPLVAIHTTKFSCIQSILSTGIRPGGLGGKRREVLSQAYFNGDPRLEEGGRKDAPIGVQWDVDKFTIDGNNCGLASQGAVSTTTAIRRQYLCRYSIRRQ
jgi:RNA:NAD 2'-phosphotransferase (TPT1/KptA family)